MDELTLITILVIAVIVIAFGCCAIMAWSKHETERKMMFFHTAGTAMASHQLRMAELEVKQRVAEAERAAHEAARAQAERTPVDHREQPIARVTSG